MTIHSLNGAAAILIIKYSALTHNRYQALHLYYYYTDVRDFGRDDELKELLVVMSAYAVVEPLAVVVEAFHALVAGAAVLAAVVDAHFADLAVVLV